MKRDLPPFSAMRAFEAAARHLSFKVASEELNVTQSAVSHQIRALEDYLAMPLFVRQTRGVSLTRAGEAYLPGLRAALDGISEATERARAENLGGRLTVSATSSFAAKWLIPRMAGFRDRYPELDVRVNVDTPVVDFERNEFDIAIRFGNGDWPGLHAERLLRSMLFPVCSPGMVSARRPLRDPADLQHHTLLHYDHGEDWGRWLRVAGAQEVDASQGIHFNDCNLMFESAIMGQGVALGYGPLLAADMAAGLLVKPFDIDLMPDDWYHLICPRTAVHRPKIKAFRRWLFDETATRDDIIPGDRADSGLHRSAGSQG